ncbi:MAG: RluA family pseudouridine synthase [Nitrospinota bacterium]
MVKKLNVRVGMDEAGRRADRFLASRLDNITRSALKRMMDSGQVTLDGEAVTPRHLTREGEEFSIQQAKPVEPKAEPEELELDIVYEDSDIVIVNKPAGMVVHPAKGHHTGTLVNGLLHHCRDLSGIGGELRPGIVHRLDKDSSGLIAAAKNDAAHASLSGQLAGRTMGREYLAVVRGTLKEKSGTIDMPIGRHPVYRKKFSVKTDSPRDAVTHYETLETFRAAAYIKVKLHTGRTHQIRVHMSAIGHPIIGDQVYGKHKSALIDRPALHAWRLLLIHPKTGKEKLFTAKPPEDFQRLLKTLREEP